MAGGSVVSDTIPTVSPTPVARRASRDFEHVVRCQAVSFTQVDMRPPAANSISAVSHLGRRNFQIRTHRVAVAEPTLQRFSLAPL